MMRQPVIRWAAAVLLGGVVAGIGWIYAHPPLWSFGSATMKDQYWRCHAVDLTNRGYWPLRMTGIRVDGERVTAPLAVAADAEAGVAAGHDSVYLPLPGATHVADGGGVIMIRTRWMRGVVLVALLSGCTMGGAPPFPSHPSMEEALGEVGSGSKIRSGVDPANAPMVKYRNAQMGVRLSYPASASVPEIDQDGPLVLGFRPFTVTLERRPDSRGETLAEWLQAEMAQAGEQVLDQGLVTLGGRQAGYLLEALLDEFRYTRT